jgi:hypothetical protein
LPRISSVAISPNRSNLPSADRRSKIKFWPFYVPEVAQGMHEGPDSRMDRVWPHHFRNGGRGYNQTYAIVLCYWPLCARKQGARNRRAADHCNELPPIHSHLRSLRTQDRDCQVLWYGSSHARARELLRSNRRA